MIIIIVLRKVDCLLTENIHCCVHAIKRRNPIILHGLWTFPPKTGQKMQACQLLAKDKKISSHLRFSIFFFRETMNTLQKKKKKKTQNNSSRLKITFDMYNCNQIKSAVWWTWPVWRKTNQHFGPNSNGPYNRKKKKKKNEAKVLHHN